MSFPDSRVFQIAQVVHEAIRVWRSTHGDKSIQVWDKASDSVKKKIVEAVEFHIDNPLAGPADIHIQWMKDREEAGWKWGKNKSDVEKTDPQMVSFHLLPPEQQAKDRLIVAIVKALVRV